MAEPPITVEEFETRLLAICTGGGSPGLPRRQRDVAVIMASATLWMEPGTLYTEKEINHGLEEWLTEVCPSLGLDKVTLRRELIDRNYLTRDDSGTSYAPGPGPVEWRFEDGVAGIDSGAVITAAIEAREARKRAYQANPP
ncbi:MAG TPA: DUF2087 domain-containing protein [Acidimicrobiia bacterium]|nr:DUF2087 domain-containing protein [Acidimicrobiia bacterium]